MKISLNEIKKLVPEAAKVDTDELIKLIGSRLVEVEEKIDLAPKYQGAYIVKVVECEAIPDTHLHLCKIDAGDISFSDHKPGQAPLNVPEKDIVAASGYIQVVCGAPNVRAGMLAVWLAPGAIVPQTYGEENFKLGVRKLRGYESNGMLAGLDEIDLGDDHSGIVELDPSMDFPGKDRNIQSGDSFAEAFDLNDIILDIENKSLTHRPDTFGLIGFAREVAGILGVAFNEPKLAEHSTKESGSAPSITIQDSTLCPRYSCAIFDVKNPVSDNKYLTQTDVFLAKAGMRGISDIVDVTNYIMLMTGQPLHAFDYDKFIAVGGEKSAKIIVRAAKDGEELQLLDGKTIKCNPSDILITSNNIPVALAGAMGGKNTEIDASTKRVILESATFSLYNLRKTQMAHGIFSEAITRFTKGQPAAQTLPVLAEAVSMLGADAEFYDSYPSPVKPSVVKITTSAINALLGTDYSEDLITKTLENVGFAVNKDGDKLSVSAPLWRTDIHIKEDIIEEVGRLLGYDNIVLDHPLRPFVGATKNPLVSLKTTIRNILAGRISAHEILTYSFVSKKLQETVGENPDNSYEIINSISPELQVFRQSLAPSILEKMRDNLKAGYKDFALFEFNQTTNQSLGKDQDGVPIMENHLALATTGDFYAAKAKLVALLGELGFSNPTFSECSGQFPYLEPLHSASVNVADTTIGEVKSPVLKRLKISTSISVFDINLDKLVAELPASHVEAQKLSKFPSVERDITIKVARGVSYDAVINPISDVLRTKDLIFSITPASIYQADGADTKNLSFHLKFASLKKTLDNTEISDIMEEVSNIVKQAVGATIV